MFINFKALWPETNQSSGQPQPERRSLVNDVVLSTVSIESVASKPAIAVNRCGIHFATDNIDFRQEVKDMTAENQNRDFHCTNHNYIKNKISGAHLANMIFTIFILGLPWNTIRR